MVLGVSLSTFPGDPKIAWGAFGFLLIGTDSLAKSSLQTSGLFLHEWGGGLALGGSALVKPPGPSTRQRGAFYPLLF